jgi:hypothetical protein
VLYPSHSRPKLFFFVKGASDALGRKKTTTTGVGGIRLYIGVISTTCGWQAGRD